MKERRFKFKLKRLNIYRSYGGFAFLFYFNFHSAILKNKYEQHWRLEIGDWLQIHFLWWYIDIYFNDNYWHEECDKRNNL